MKEEKIDKQIKYLPGSTKMKRRLTLSLITVIIYHENSILRTSHNKAFHIDAFLIISKNKKNYVKLSPLASSSSSSSSSVSTQTKTTTEKIKHAMLLSTKGQTNIAAAYDASSLWEDILYPKNVNNDDDNKSASAPIIPNNIKKICNALYAATLVRIGRDDDALIIYEETLNILDVVARDGTRTNGDFDNTKANSIVNLDISSSDLSLWVDVKIAKGEALQRLMKYKKAKDEFLQVCLSLRSTTADNNSNSNNDNDDISNDGERKFQQTASSVIENYYNRLSQCTYKAALCSLRLGDLQGAEDVLTSEYNYYKPIIINDNNNTSKSEKNDTGNSICYENADIIGMLGVVQIEQELQRRNNATFSEESTSVKLLKSAALSKGASPVYKWFYELMTIKMMTDIGDDKNYGDGSENKIRQSRASFLFGDNIEMTREQLLQISSINNSPYDDPLLINLDDKVLLHQLLTNNNNMEQYDTFWPTGFVLPQDEHKLKKYCNDKNTNNIHTNNDQKQWIIKRRAGYGSHGNQVVSTNEAITKSSNLLNLSGDSNDDELLCQKLIEPALCYKGRRFSLRIYVIYFQSNGKSKTAQVYISKTGLMKLALVENYAVNAIENDVYMTNSGRAQGEELETQHDFLFLEGFMDEEHGPGSYEKLWISIRHSVNEVMAAFFETKKLDENKGFKFIGSVPKIMGFDYLIDSSLKPWLMEVNRFPGLESRGEDDWVVKSELIKNTWKLATARYDDNASLGPSMMNEFDQINVSNNG